MSWLKRYTPILLLAMLLPPFLSFLRAKSELYEDTDSLLLNVQLPRTRWMNMGYWEREAMAFDEAAAGSFRLRFESRDSSADRGGQLWRVVWLRRCI